jgi:hypothetical protein
MKNISDIKSPLLMESQISIIYSKLSEAPKLYATEELEVKEVAVKLFSPSMVFYVVEYNSDTRIAFGYMQNDFDSSLSEWGYSSIDELIEKGFEMDLYFKDRCVLQDGSVHELELY